MKKGILYLIPTTLGGENLDLIITPFVREVINSIDHYIVEKEKHARRYLRKLDIQKAIDDLTLFPLNKHTEISEFAAYLHPAISGQDMGLISEAGCPGIADPGAEIVALAHKQNIEVIPLTGPSSIFLALMGSGFSGQGFTFHGYLPKEKSDRNRKIKEMERNKKVTQIFMDTPFRNNHVLDDLLMNCKPDTKLSIGVDLTMESQSCLTKTVANWKKAKPNLNKRPCIFLIGEDVIKS